ncbi:MAG: HDOD domain-containing protein [Methylococcaceae bacterium]|nr:HDOD domain-containing protein [Methylococcaceae bacterium]
MNRTEALRIITDQAASAPLHFAGHVEIGLRIRDALNDPDCHVDAAAKLIQAEPALSAQVVAIANSAAYNTSGRAITDVKTAVSRIGFATLRSLAAAHIVKHLAGVPTNATIKALTDQLWRHTTHVAALCRTIARRVTRQNPESALFIGLVHEVGNFYLLSRAGEFPALIEAQPAQLPDRPAPSFEEEAAATPTHAVGDDPVTLLERELTLTVLRQLQVPAPAIEAVGDYFAGYMELPPSSMADTLLLAESLAPVGSPLSSVVNSDADDPVSIDAAIGDSTLSEILKESAAEVESLAKALGT